METASRTDVIIVGAGPTGLSLACQLARYGIDFVIIEKNEGVTPYSKAIGVHARTLEIYEQIGLSQKAIERGAIAGKARMLEGGELRAELDLSNIGQGLSPYPYMLLLEQSKNEQLLYEYLRSREREVLWKTELESISQTEAGTTARVKTADGSSRIIEAKYLAGCDGAKSMVRRAIGLGFQGSTFERLFYVADAHVEWKFSHDALHICLSKDSLLLFFPLKGEKRYRIVGTFPEEFKKDEGDILYEEIEGRIKAEAKLELDIHDVEWFSTYKVHTRHVDRFSAGRCFLAGDSAHIHSPAGAQGMNTGIQDAYNLAWKMAMVLRDGAGEKLLDTYNEERLENAKDLLQTTDRLFQLGAGSEWILAFLRTNVLPSVARYVLGFDTIRNFIFHRISQIGINYRHGSLSQHAGDEDFKVKAGDRMPYLQVGGESIYDRLHEPRFHLLAFSDSPSEIQALQPEVESRFAESVDSYAIPLDEQAAEIFGTEKPFNLLLRPDNYIGFISSDTSPGRLQAYLSDFIRGR
ncbi:MAG TPA: FAD-dependent monooxygenase [Blastocatellia bacterium]|jgi:2-polyprenyl-6-methoxyphenol hydroxylase-like FAD-dependent oxidoreductase|nr:FAD-dependent monooxygenase [Blastocatellia bacterium]